MLRCKLVPEIHCGSLSLTPTVLFSLVTKSLEFGSLQFTSYDSVNLFMKLAFSSLLRESAFTSVWVISCHPCLSEAPAPGERPGSLWADKGPIPIQNLQNRPKEHPKICIFYKCWDGADAAQVASRWKALEEPLTYSFEASLCKCELCLCDYLWGVVSSVLSSVCPGWDGSCYPGARRSSRTHYIDGNGDSSRRNGSQETRELPLLAVLWINTISMWLGSGIISLVTSTEES